MEKFSELLREFIQTIGQAGESRFDAEGMPINLKQHFILTMLSKSEEIFQSLIAEILRKDKSAVLREIDLLESQGLVLRVGDASDRRKKRIMMTDEGRDMFNRGQAIIHNLMADLTAGISPEEMDAFRQTMARISQNGKSMNHNLTCKP
jgi:DNA-binding MarR family transcriptional regulator